MRRLWWLPGIVLAVIHLVLSIATCLLLGLNERLGDLVAWIGEAAHGLPHPSHDDRRDERVWDAVGTWLRGK